MSIVLPDRSVNNGHLDYAGGSTYGFQGLMSWVSSTYRIRVIMSSTTYHLVVQMDNGGTSFAYLDFSSNWDDFERIGMCACWNVSYGTQYANLYVNGQKLDSVSAPADFYPQNLASSTVYIGTDGSSGAAADCWIPRLALGRKPIHRSYARLLSMQMRDYARCGTLGDMSYIVS
jgi:hypothetical protein